MNVAKNLRVFIQEDDGPQRTKIEDELKDLNYKIYFLPKDESVFDLIKFCPDIIIQDYSSKKVINFHEWAIPI